MKIFTNTTEDKIEFIEALADPKNAKDKFVDKPRAELITEDMNVISSELLFRRLKKHIAKLAPQSDSDFHALLCGFSYEKLINRQYAYDLYHPEIFVNFHQTLANALSECRDMTRLENNFKQYFKELENTENGRTFLATITHKWIEALGNRFYLNNPENKHIRESATPVLALIIGTGLEKCSTENTPETVATIAHLVFPHAQSPASTLNKACHPYAVPLTTLLATKLENIDPKSHEGARVMEELLRDSNLHKPTTLTGWMNAISERGTPPTDVEITWINHAIQLHIRQMHSVADDVSDMTSKAIAANFKRLGEYLSWAKTHNLKLPALTSNDRTFSALCDIIWDEQFKAIQPPENNTDSFKSLPDLYHNWREMGYPYRRYHRQMIEAGYYATIRPHLNQEDLLAKDPEGPPLAVLIYQAEAQFKQQVQQPAETLTLFRHKDGWYLGKEKGPVVRKELPASSYKIEVPMEAAILLETEHNTNASPPVSLSPRYVITQLDPNKTLEFNVITTIAREPLEQFNNRAQKLFKELQKQLDTSLTSLPSWAVNID